jgi:uncharacterized membrane protein YhhN
MTRPADCTCNDEPMHLWPQAAFQLVGLALLLVAVGYEFDGWFVIGALGASLLAGWLNAVPRAIVAFMRSGSP